MVNYMWFKLISYICPNIKKNKFSIHNTKYNSVYRAKIILFYIAI